jgi:hypothetical protein
MSTTLRDDDFTCAQDPLVIFQSMISSVFCFQPMSSCEFKLQSFFNQFHSRWKSSLPRISSSSIIAHSLSTSGLLAFITDDNVWVFDQKVIRDNVIFLFLSYVLKVYLIRVLSLIAVHGYHYN